LSKQNEKVIISNSNHNKCNNNSNSSLWFWNVQPGYNDVVFKYFWP